MICEKDHSELRDVSMPTIWHYTQAKILWGYTYDLCSHYCVCPLVTDGKQMTVIIINFIQEI